MYYSNKTRSTMSAISKKRAIFLLVFIIFLVLLLPGRTEAEGLSLENPIETLLTTPDGIEIGQSHEMTMGQSLFLYFKYGDISGIEADKVYPLPSLPSGLKLSLTGTDEGDGVTAIPLAFEDGGELGTLRYDKATGVMSLQFAEYLDAAEIINFYLKLAITMNEEEVGEGQTITFSFPSGSEEDQYSITIIEAKKDLPTINKSGPTTDNNGTVTGFDAASNEITWTITVEQGENPYPELQIKDTYSDNQEYVADSFQVDGSAPAEGSVDIDEAERLIVYNLSAAAAGQTTTITYKTRIKNSAFLDTNGVPLNGGTIKCTNQAQAIPPGDNTDPGEPVQAEYDHAINWLYKTSGNVINWATGEMEWTVIIYNNNLSMNDVVFYDRLSPGIVVKDNTATMQVGSGEVQNLTDFMRTSDIDLKLDDDSDYSYNLKYDLPGTIDKVTVIKYKTIIDNEDEYNAAEHPSPDSPYDNRAFITYRVEGGSYTGIVKSPVVVKESAIDAGLLGKTGEVGDQDRAYHTITWTLTVNTPGATMTGVKISDTLTPGGTTVSNPVSHTVYEHVYADLERNKPVFAYHGKSKTLKLNTGEEDEPYTYRLIKDENEKVYKLVFYLGDLDEEGTLVYRSTVTDPNIYAINYTNGTKYAFENKAELTTTEGYGALVSAEATYNSQVIDKAAGVNYFNQQTGAYDFNKNQFPWQILFNKNRMEMINIRIMDTLAIGTSLVPGSVRIGQVSLAYYKLTEIIPEGTSGSTKPYYTYDEQTRELQIYLPDITGDVVGTDAAYQRIAFFVQVDINNSIFKDAGPDSDAWAIQNTASLFTAEHPVGVQSPKRTEWVKAQMTSKTGKPYNNNGEYSIDYSVDINRLHAELPDKTQLTDTLPAGLTLDVATVKLYEATVRAASGYGDENSVGKNEGGVFIKGEEVDPELYQYSVAANADGTETFTLTLPDNSGTSPYILEYSCIITDISKAPFTNSIEIAGYSQFADSHTVQELEITGATGGGTIVTAEKTEVKVIKKDSVTQKELSGAEFGLYYKDNLVKSGTTDENGSLLFTELIVGREYEIRELRAPDGYKLTNASQTFTAEKTAEPREFVFENDPENNQEIVPPAGVITQLLLWLVMTAVLVGILLAFMFSRRRRFKK